MSARRTSRLATACLVLALGSGCDISGCQGRGGSEPIPAGFPSAERVTRAGQARVTSAGLDAIEPIFAGVISPYDSTNYPLNFNPNTFSGSGVTASICASVACSVTYEVLDASLTVPNGATNEVVLGVHLRRRSLVNGAFGPWPVTSNIGSCGISLDQTITLPLTVRIREAGTALRGDTTSIAFDEITSIPALNLTANCSGALSLVWTLLGSAVNAQASASFQSAIIRAANEVVAGSRCQPSIRGCPLGSTAFGDGFCHEGADVDSPCVPRLGGEELRGDLGAALLGLPHSGAFGEYLLAAVGDGVATSGGISVDLAGGLRSTDEDFDATGDVSSGQPLPHICVPPATRPAPPLIPALTALQANDIPGTSTPYHIGIGLSDEWLSYLGFELYESGALCITASGADGTEIAAAVSVPSLASAVSELSFPVDHPSLRVSMRPQIPPRVDAETNSDGDAVLVAAIDTVFVDVELFVQERFTRLFTYVVHPRLELRPRVDGSIVAFDVARVTRIAPSTVGNILVTGVDEAALIAELDARSVDIFAALFRNVPGLALPVVPGTTTRVLPGGIRSLEQGGQGFFVLFGEIVGTP